MWYSLWGKLFTREKRSTWAVPVSPGSKTPFPHPSPETGDCVERHSFRFTQVGLPGPVLNHLMSSGPQAKFQEFIPPSCDWGFLKLPHRVLCVAVLAVGPAGTFIVGEPQFRSWFIQLKGLKQNAHDSFMRYRVMTARFSGYPDVPFFYGVCCNAFLSLQKWQSSELKVR